MLQTRVIPVLLLRGGGLVKTLRFGQPKYVGDPINAVRIFNEKEVDELTFLDIEATPKGHGPNFDLLSSIVNEAFMPFGYGGGISSVEQVRRILGMGVEKVILNTAASQAPRLIEEAARVAGSSSVVGSMDVKRNWRGKCSVFVSSGTVNLGREPTEYAQTLAAAGVGEILVNSMDRDGTQEGYDTDLIRSVAAAVDVPVVAVGGAGRVEDLRTAVDSGASAAAAGSLFVFHGKHRAVLITYPDRQTLTRLFDRDHRDRSEGF